MVARTFTGFEERNQSAVSVQCTFSLLSKLHCFENTGPYITISKDFICKQIVSTQESQAEKSLILSRPFCQNSHLLYVLMIRASVFES